MNANIGKYSRTPLTIMRQAKSQAIDKYSVGGREKRPTRPVPSLPKLKCLQREAEFGDEKPMLVLRHLAVVALLLSRGEACRDGPSLRACQTDSALSAAWAPAPSAKPCWVIYR